MKDLIDAFIGAVDAAREDAQARHEDGTCHLSEWSCSYCEREGCVHDWLLRPESDTYVCLICGEER
jgi:hypothetical protein